MEIIYAGTDESFATLLAGRLTSAGIEHEHLVAKPKPEIQAIRELHFIRAQGSSWPIAVDLSGALLEERESRFSSELEAARLHASAQANKRGRLEVAAIGFLIFGVLAGFLAYPYVKPTAECPWVPVISTP